MYNHSLVLYFYWLVFALWLDITGFFMPTVVTWSVQSGDDTSVWWCVWDECTPAPAAPAASSPAACLSCWAVILPLSHSASQFAACRQWELYRAQVIVQTCQTDWGKSSNSWMHMSENNEIWQGIKCWPQTWFAQKLWSLVQHNVWTIILLRFRHMQHLPLTLQPMVSLIRPDYWGQKWNSGL